MAIEVFRLVDWDGETQGTAYRCDSSGAVFGPSWPDMETAEAFLTWVLAMTRMDLRAHLGGYGEDPCRLRRDFERWMERHGVDGEGVYQMTEGEMLAFECAVCGGALSEEQRLHGFDDECPRCRSIGSRKGAA